MRDQADKKAYGADLAHVHDDGFGGFARAAAPVIEQLLREQGHHGGSVVELGCGSGIQAAAISKAGYDVLGFDISPAMVELARKRVPRGTFRCQSFLDAELPPCVAVTAVGEIFNYLFDRRNLPKALLRLFRRIHEALVPRGLLVFDVALVGRVPEGRRRMYAEGDDWACLFEAEEDRARKRLTRRITTFRRQGRHYRRDAEVHHLRLYERDELLKPLREIGFRVRTLRRYGELAFPPGYLAIVASKR